MILQLAVEHQTREEERKRVSLPLFPDLQCPLPRIFVKIKIRHEQVCKEGDILYGIFEIKENDTLRDHGISPGSPS